MYSNSRYSIRIQTKEEEEEEQSSSHSFIVFADRIVGDLFIYFFGIYIHTDLIENIINTCRSFVELCSFIRKKTTRWSLI